MKFLRLTILVCSILYFNSFVTAQEQTLSEDYKKETIKRLSELMVDRYVFPEVAKKTEVHLKKQWKEGYFNKIKTIEDFAEALTESVQSVNKDKHMRIRKKRPTQAAPNTPEAMIEDRIFNINRTRKSTGGFAEVKKMEGNVGYLDIRGFHGTDIGGPSADSYMNLLATSDAIIIDLRKNGGGSPDMVRYLCSYFFEGEVHLNSLYFKEIERLTFGHWKR